MEREWRAGRRRIVNRLRNREWQQRGNLRQHTRFAFYRPGGYSMSRHTNDLVATLDGQTKITLPQRLERAITGYREMLGQSIATPA
jgi:hypothetical protein